MSKESKEKKKEKQIRIPAEYTEGTLRFKSGPGWKACYDSERELYTAEAYLAGYYDLYETNEEIFKKLKKKGMARRDAHELIITGRHLYKSVSDKADSAMGAMGGGTSGREVQYGKRPGFLPVQL